MHPLRIFYSDTYAPSDSPHLSRLAVTASVLKAVEGTEFSDPGPLNLTLLEGLHSPDYLAAFHDGAGTLASSQGIPWSPAVRDSAFAMLSGQLRGAEHAMNSGIAMNLARGFHHAVYERGSGYCALNGLAFVAHQFPDKKVFVLDCDEHGGNGTEEFTERLPNLYNFSIFGTRFGCFGGTASTAIHLNVRQQGFDAYLDALEQARDSIARQQPDIILYQAGADTHKDDPKGRVQMETSEMYQRDKTVFEMARDLDIPLLFVVAGGYQSAEEVALLNANTVNACVEVYGGLAQLR